MNTKLVSEAADPIDGLAREGIVVVGKFVPDPKPEFQIEVIKVRQYKAGYEIRTERVEYGSNPEVIMKSAYAIPGGDYIGSSKRAHRLIVKRGIKPEKANPNHNVCSIGFSERTQKWWGWSHRAICGFGIGDVVTDEDHLCSMSGWTDEYLAEHPEEDLSLPVGFVAETLEDAKRMAVAFAAAVS